MTKDHAYLYLSSFAEAKRQNEVALWRASHLENISCKQAIEEAIRKGFDGMHLSHDCARGIIEDFGFKRVGWVLSATLQQKAVRRTNQPAKQRRGPPPPSSRPATAIMSLPWRATPPCWTASSTTSARHRQS